MADVVQQYHPHDLRLSAGAVASGDGGANPFLVEVRAVLEGPDGRRTAVPGFYDGDGTWVVRVCPNERGTWRYTLESAVPALAGRRGELRCVASQNPRVHGALRVDPLHRHHFRVRGRGAPVRAGVRGQLAVGAGLPRPGRGAPAAVRGADRRVRVQPRLRQRLRPRHPLVPRHDPAGGLRPAAGVRLGGHERGARPPAPERGLLARLRRDGAGAVRRRRDGAPLPAGLQQGRQLAGQPLAGRRPLLPLRRGPLPGVLQRGVGLRQGVQERAGQGLPGEPPLPGQGPRRLPAPGDHPRRRRLLLRPPLRGGAATS